MNKYLPIVFAVFAGGCAVGPDYQAPQPLHPKGFFAAGGPAAGDPAAGGPAAKEAQSLEYSGQTFWRGFQDPILDDLISQTLANNYSLQAMLARYRGAAALLRQARRDQWPSVTAFAGASDQRLAEVEQVQPGADERELYQAGAALHWELDLFGRLARATEARKAQLEASGADLRAMQVALVGQLANSYFELRGLQQQLEVVRQNVSLQQSSLDVVSARVDAGRGTVFDVLRARAQLNATRAAIPQLQAAIRGHMHRIGVLTGKGPSALVDELRVATALPETVPVIPVGTPGEVLRRRPDIRAAERRVAAATASVGVATADLFPRFTLQGLLGSLATDSGDLFTGAAESRRIAFGIDWTFLDMAQVRARIDAADAEADAALADYRQSVLLALEETETWLVRYQQAQARVALLADAAEAAGQAVAQARKRYGQGYTDYFQLLTAELELSHARESLVQSRTERALAMVNVYRSLAGAPEMGGRDGVDSLAFASSGSKEPEQL